jgi:hypothetical protein
MGETNACKILVEEPEGARLFRISERRYQDNIKIGLGVMEREGVAIFLPRLETSSGLL